jgi:hypothetical protein
VWVGALLGVVALVKFTFFLAAVGAVGLIAGIDLWRRRPPWTLVAFGATTLVLWLALGQPLSGFARFVGGSLEVTRGYTEAMSTHRPARAVIALVVASVGGAVLTMGVLARRRRSLGAVAIALALLGVGVLAFRQASFGTTSTS